VSRSEDAVIADHVKASRPTGLGVGGGTKATSLARNSCDSRATSASRRYDDGYYVVGPEVGSGDEPRRGNGFIERTIRPKRSLKYFAGTWDGDYRRKRRFRRPAFHRSNHPRRSDRLPADWHHQTMHHLLSLAVIPAVVGITWFASPDLARAECADPNAPFSCICTNLPTTILEGLVSEDGTGSQHVVIEAIYGDPAEYEIGDPYELATTDLSIAPGTRVIVHLAGRQEPIVEPIGVERTVNCVYPPMPVDEAIEMALADDCDTQVDARFPYGTCDDLVGCALGGRPLGSLGLLALTLLPFARARRRLAVRR